MKESGPSPFLVPVGALASLVVVGVLGCAPALAQSSPPPSPGPSPDPEGTLQVTGQAQVQLPADRVIITLAVETESESAQGASAQNAERMERVVVALREAGGHEVRMETFGYALLPQYLRPNQGEPSTQTIVSYRALNHIRVILQEVGRAGELLDVGISAGANRVMGLQFSATDTREARLEALREAVRTAREEAQTIADAMAVILGPAIEVRGGASVPPPGIMYRSMDAPEAGRATTPVEAAEQTVSANVTITYRILETGR